MSQYFPPYTSSGRNIKVELDMSSYATKNDLKYVTHVDVSSFASKTNLASLKTEVDKLDIDKLTPVPVDLAKLSNIVKYDVVKKTEYNKLVGKVDNIDTIKFVLKATYDSHLEKKISDVDEKIPDTSSLVKKRDLNKQLNFLSLTIIIRNIFEKDGKHYLQIFEMAVCMKYKYVTI